MHAPAPPPLQALGLALAASLTGAPAAVDPGDRLVTRLDFATFPAMLRAVAADLQALTAAVPPEEIALVVPGPMRLWRFHLPRAIDHVASGAVTLWEPAALAAADRRFAFQFWLDVHAPDWPGGRDEDAEAAGALLAALAGATSRGMRWYGCRRDACGNALAGRLPARLAEVLTTTYAGLGGAP
ncbi:MAG: hypothetical protein ACLGIN_03305 [Candidatus Sericytochromatia bacterium]